MSGDLLDPPIHAERKPPSKDIIRIVSWAASNHKKDMQRINHM